MTRKLQELIVARATEVAVKEEAVAGGMRSMRADGLAKALAGRTTLEEVPRVTPPDPGLARRAGQAAAGAAGAVAPAPAQVAPPPKAPPKVLVLDDDRHTRDRATAAGATGFISKPFGDAQLRGEVAAILQRRPALADHPA